MLKPLPSQLLEAGSGAPETKLVARQKPAAAAASCSSHFKVEGQQGWESSAQKGLVVSVMGTFSIHLVPS